MTEQAISRDTLAGGKACCKVMIVDDSFLMRHILKNILKKDQVFEVVAEAANGEEALDQLSSIGDIDLILLDIEMPVMDGLEFMKSARLKTRARIIVVSSVAKFSSPEAKEALLLGAVDIIAKPSGVLSMDLEEKKSREVLDSVRRAVT